MAIGRFQVMSILQACRAEALGMNHDSALSYGLNRAIFFAAAKRGFKGRGSSRNEKHKSDEESESYVLDAKVATTKKGNIGNTQELRFTIGGTVQTPEDFRKQVVSRFQDKAAFQKAWINAMKIVCKYDKETLKSSDHFYEQVYKPIRDQLATQWNINMAREELE